MSKPIKLIILFLLSGTLLHAQQKDEGVFLGKAELYKAKKTAIDYLSDSSSIEKIRADIGCNMEFCRAGNAGIPVISPVDTGHLRRQALKLRKDWPGCRHVLLPPGVQGNRLLAY